MEEDGEEVLVTPAMADAGCQREKNLNKFTLIL